MVSYSDKLFHFLQGIDYYYVKYRITVGLELMCINILRYNFLDLRGRKK